MAIVGFWIANDFSLAVDGTVRGAYHHFSLAVAIEVVDDKRRIVGAAADVDAQIDAPEQSAVETVAVEEGRTSVAVVGVIV